MGVLVALAGCAAPHKAAVLTPSAIRPGPANLLLGPAPEDARVAQQFTGRSDWPVAVRGYRLDEVTFYSRSYNDYQVGYGRHDGGWHGTSSVTVGTWVR